MFKVGQELLYQNTVGWVPSGYPVRVVEIIENSYILYDIEYNDTFRIEKSHADKYLHELYEPRHSTGNFDSRER